MPKKQIVVISILLLEIVAVLIFGKSKAPIQQGTSEKFWKIACGVDIDPKVKGPLDGFYGVYQPRDDWFIYYQQGYHQQFFFRVPRLEAVADYPEVLQKIAQSTNEKDTAPMLRFVRTAIEQSHLQGEVSPERLLLLIRNAELMRRKAKSEKVYQYALSQEQAFSELWVRIQRFWLNIVFESFFFVGLTLFAFWPWLTNKGAWRMSLHLGFLPLFLFFPYYLGYCGWTFYSIGPSGGVLYPWVIIWFRGIPLWTPVDQWVIVTLPKVLEPLSQPLGPMLSISGGRPLGPVAALLMGLVVFLLAQALFSYLKRRSFAKQITIGNASDSENRESSHLGTEVDSVNRAP